MKKILSLMCLCLFSCTIFAGTSNIIQIVKTTTLTNFDAENFKMEFNGGTMPQMPESKVYVSCSGFLNACEITTYASSVTGYEADMLLSGREHVDFSTSDGNFAIHCGQSIDPNPPHNSLSYCNFSQKHAMLVD